MDILEQLKANVERAVSEPPKAPKPGSDIRRADIPPKGGAWLIETPRLEYWGACHGVQFRNGMGILDVDEPDAIFRAHRLEHDHHYKVTALDSRLADKFREQFSKQQKPKASGIETLMKPGNI
jgi:hypothetical protein